jgi:hypothetical protein
MGLDFPPVNPTDQLIRKIYHPKYGRAKRMEHLRQDMEKEKGLLAQMRSGITSSCIKLPQWLRFCPLCTEEDEKQFGDRYWHRLHQVPGVEACPIHAVFLEDSKVRHRLQEVVTSLSQPTRQ